MKNKKLFKSLTTSALILTSAMAFSSSAFADAKEFTLNTATNNLEAEITNTFIDDKITLIFTKKFTGGEFQTWEQRKLHDSNLAKFENKDEFKNIFTLQRKVSTADDSTYENMEQKNDAVYISNTKYYRVISATADNDTSTIVYKIEVDKNTPDATTYSFRIDETNPQSTYYQQQS